MNQDDWIMLAIVASFVAALLLIVIRPGPKPDRAIYDIESGDWGDGGTPKDV